MEPRTADRAIDTTKHLVPRAGRQLADQAEHYARALSQLHAEAEIQGERGPDLDLMAHSLHAWARWLRGRARGGAA